MNSTLIARSFEITSAGVEFENVRCWWGKCAFYKIVRPLAFIDQRQFPGNPRSPLKTAECDTSTRIGIKIY